MGGKSLTQRPRPEDFLGNPLRMMEAAFRHGYKGAQREYDVFLDEGGTRSEFTAMRAVYGGMLVCHVIRHETDPSRNVRKIIWYFRRARSTPAMIELWAGNARFGFPEGSLDPKLISMIPTDRQIRCMHTPQWQKLRVKRAFK